MNYSQIIIPSPLGDLIAIASDDHLVMLEFADSPSIEKKITKVTESPFVRMTKDVQPKGAIPPSASIRGNRCDTGVGCGSAPLVSQQIPPLSEGQKKNRILEQTERELSEYFAGTRINFDIPLAPLGTDFQKIAWQALGKIPYGETRSYKEEAILAGNPQAVRAIGGANNKNPIVIIIPCHRVIGADGSLVGYGGGIERKLWLLKHERKK